MGGEDDPVEILKTVVDRRELLRRFADGPKDKRTLESEVSVSRSTVNRAVRELELLELIEYGADGYRLTPVGEFVTGAAEDALEQVAAAARFTEFLQWVPRSEFDLGLQHLRDADLHTADAGDPWSMINEHVARLKEASSVRASLPVTGLHAFEVVHDRVVHGDARMELLVEPDVAETHRTDAAYADLFEKLSRTDRYEMYVYPDSFPFGVAVIDETVQLLAVDGDDPKAIVETDDAAVREWAHGQLDAYERRATEFEAGEGAAPSEA
ncbi:hypothetical protein G9464_03400 [Halostella sp. JP-L12]|uniref:helix-turn-helix transcriptional regulator n=1 Tax=Halostella TaxID=1843185 RepID=UPI000EF80591|nr:MULTISPECIES: hypothetical protein [Halostella]NHN46641.1 hypothetical protein [Halostella sp. JP-L12]